MVIIFKRIFYVHDHSWSYMARKKSCRHYLLFGIHSITVPKVLHYCSSIAWLPINCPNFILLPIHKQWLVPPIIMRCISNNILFGFLRDIFAKEPKIFIHKRKIQWGKKHYLEHEKIQRQYKSQRFNPFYRRKSVPGIRSERWRIRLTCWTPLKWI